MLPPWLDSLVLFAHGEAKLSPSSVPRNKRSKRITTRLSAATRSFGAFATSLEFNIMRRVSLGARWGSVCVCRCEFVECMWNGIRCQSYEALFLWFAVADNKSGCFAAWTINTSATMNVEYREMAMRVYACAFSRVMISLSDICFRPPDVNRMRMKPPVLSLPLLLECPWTCSSFVFVNTILLIGIVIDSHSACQGKKSIKNRKQSRTFTEHCWSHPIQAIT